MTRVLVVNHDLDLADQEADSLRRHGYEVIQCMGPIGAQCPVLSGKPCELAGEADVLLYDAWATGEPDGARQLIENLRELHPAVPVVLSSTVMEPDWLELTGRHRVTPLVGAPTADRLIDAIGAALAGREAPSAQG
jgi:hypothetical protein